MFEFLVILLGGLVIGYFVSFSIYKNQYSADQYVSKKLFDEEKQHVIDLNEEKLQLSTEIAKHEEMIANYEIKLQDEKEALKKQYDQMKNQFENLANVGVANCGFWTFWNGGLDFL